MIFRTTNEAGRAQSARPRFFFVGPPGYWLRERAEGEGMIRTSTCSRGTTS
jgi:hypothetical protein